jgi:hypothetical protein
MKKKIVRMLFYLVKEKTDLSDLPAYGTHTKLYQGLALASLSRAKICRKNKHLARIRNYRGLCTEYRLVNQIGWSFFVFGLPVIVIYVVWVCPYVPVARMYCVHTFAMLPNSYYIYVIIYSTYVHTISPLACVGTISVKMPLRYFLFSNRHICVLNNLLFIVIIFK